MIWATRGGVAIGLCVLLWHMIEWWPGVKALKDRKKLLLSVGDLLPFLFAAAYGALGILSVMGLIGWVFDAALWVANWLGDVAGFIGVGAKVGQTSHGSYLPLTSDGSWIVVLLTVAFFGLKAKTETLGKCLTRGVITGFTLGTSAGVAGLAAAPLAQGANEAGALLFGAIG